MKAWIPILLITALSTKAQQGPPPVGGWREHFPWDQAIDLAIAPGKLFCASPYAVFSFEPTTTKIERWSTVSGLTAAAIASIAFDAVNNRLIIAYQDSHIDIVTDNDISALPDIPRSTVTGDKSILHIYPFRQLIFLSAGLGVIVLDADKKEVKDTWLIGAGGGKIRTKEFASDNQYYYAATDEGLKRVPVGNSNPGNYLNWQTMSGNNGLPAGPCDQVFTSASTVIAAVHDSLWEWNGSNWQLFFGNSDPILKARFSGDRVLVAQSHRIIVLSASGTVLSAVTNLPAGAQPANLAFAENELWMADRQNGLVHFQPGGFTLVRPNAPAALVLGDMACFNQELYASAGAIASGRSPANIQKGLFRLTQGEWTNFDRSTTPALDTIADLVTLTMDPAGESIWAGSFGGGLVHISGEGKVLQVFKQGFLLPAFNDPASYRVGGLAIDRNRNLWIANDGATEPVAVRKSDGNWKRFSLPFSLAGNAVAQILVDDNNLKWIIAPNTNAVVCFDDGSTIDNTGDDRWKLISTGTGNGNLPVGSVRCLAKDRNGFIWIGTSNGIAVVQCGADLFSAGGCDALWPVVQQGNFAGYLFNGEDVQCLAVDGADRKWVGTKNGVWLISPGGEKIIYHFETSNSPLPSNDIRKIVVDASVGEVFFATASGLCSFRSTATEGGATNEQVLIFPNPVPPGYAGTIAVRGVAENAVVKITELNGRLVFQTRALGGQAVWNRRDYRGRKLETGVYLVLVSDDSRREQYAGKIIFISK